MFTQQQVLQSNIQSYALQWSRHQSQVMNDAATGRPALGAATTLGNAMQSASNSAISSHPSTQSIATSTQASQHAKTSHDKRCITSFFLSCCNRTSQHEATND